MATADENDVSEPRQSEKRGVFWLWVAGNIFVCILGN